jgi:hypothetical protein
LTEFDYTEADFIDAHRLHSTPSRAAKVSGALFVLVAAAYVFWRTQDIQSALLTLVATPLLLALVSFLFWQRYLPWMARRSYAALPAEQLHMKVALLSMGLQTQSSRGSNLLEWRDLLQWRANEKTTVIYLSPLVFLHIPSRVAGLGFPVQGLRDALMREVGQPRA